MTDSAPLADYEILKDRIGNQARLVGKVINVSGDTCLVETCGGHTITVHTQKVMTTTSNVQTRHPRTRFAAFQGLVKPDLSVDAETCDDFGDNFDMENLSSLVQLMKKNSEIFSLSD